MADIVAALLPKPRRDRYQMKAAEINGRGLSPANRVRPAEKSPGITGEDASPQNANMARSSVGR